MIRDKRRNDKLWGCVRMHSLVAPNSLEAQHKKIRRLVVYFSEREFCSWKTVLSVNLNVFEENKMSVFRPLPAAFKTNRQGSLGKGTFGSVSKHELDGVLYVECLHACIVHPCIMLQHKLIGKTSWVRTTYTLTTRLDDCYHATYRYAVKEIDLTHLIDSQSSEIYRLELVKCFLEAQVLIALRDSTLMQLRCLAFDLHEDDRSGAQSEWGVTGTTLLKRLYLVMDFAKGGDLRQYTFSQQQLPQLVLLRVWRELFTGLK